MDGTYTPYIQSIYHKRDWFFGLPQKDWLVLPNRMVLSDALDLRFSPLRVCKAAAPSRNIRPDTVFRTEPSLPFLARLGLYA